MTDWPLPSAFEPPADPRALLDWLDEQEARIADVVADVATRVVRDAYADYLATLEPDVEPGAVTAAGDLNALDSIPQRWSIAATGRILPELNGMFVAGGIAAWTQSGATAIDGSAWANVVNQQAVGYIATASNRLAGVGNNLWWGVRSLTRKAVEAGATNEDLKRNIQALTKFSEFRADTIARTETVGAFNNGEYAGNLALGDEGPVEKWWLATRDARSREAHVAAQPVEMGGRGKVIPYSATFEVGGVDMLHPHAPGAPAAQVVNCRCVLITLYPGDERPDGTIVPERTLSPNPPPTPPTPPPAPPPAKKAARPRRPATRIPRQGFATADEAVDFLAREHPQIAFGPTMRAGAPENLTAIARSAESLARRYPKQWARMRHIGTESIEDVNAAKGRVHVFKTTWSNNTYAHAWTSEAYSRDEGLIGFNPRWLNNLEAALEAKRRDKVGKWTVGVADMSSTMDHEFGHLYRYLRLRDARAAAAGDVPGYGYVMPNGTGTLSTAHEELFTFVHRNRMKKWGSEYGGKNAEEAFAECFAAREYLAAGGEPTEGLRKMAAVMDLFDDLVDAARGIKYSSGYNPVAKLEMLEELEALYVKHGIDFRPKNWKADLKAARHAVKQVP